MKMIDQIMNQASWRIRFHKSSWLGIYTVSIVDTMGNPRFTKWFFTYNKANKFYQKAKVILKLAPYRI